MCFLFRGNLEFITFRQSRHYVWLRKGAVRPFVLMILYECYWIRYFHSKRTMADFYSSFLGFPVAGASLPVIAVILLSLYAGNVLLLAAGIVLGIGHIGIHLMHRKEIQG